MPQTLDALERYLANGTIKGIGPATAKKIVGTFGEETIIQAAYTYEQEVKFRENHKPEFKAGAE